MNRRITALIALISLAVFSGSAAPAQSAAENAEFFEKRVRPMLAEKCYSCHGADSRPLMGSLRLDARAGMLKGGGRGPLFVAGHPDQSLIVRAVRYTQPGLQMPPGGKLADDQIAILTEWVQRGGFVPAGGAGDRVGGSARPDFAARARHWSWQPIRRPAVPAVQRRGWVRNPIDSFILAKLEARRLAPARPADKRTLLRRVTYDLIGLPPTTSEIRAFLSDTSPNAYEKVVDRLLASPHYGERWARHWLDLVRYAETDGHEWDIEKTGAWQYRDYVIRALNADVPYNQFVLEHIAGDLLPHPRTNPQQGFNESVLGTGFFFLGSAAHSPVDLQADEAERIDNQIDVLGKAFLGMGVGCARCHDHKFDAITARDYYALYGFLKGMRQQEAPVGPPLSAPTRTALSALQSRARQALSRSARNAADSALDVHRSDWGARLETARKDPASPLYAIARLSAEAAESGAERFEQVRQDVLRRMREQAEAAAAQKGKLRWIGGESGQRSWEGWTVTGEAFSVPDVARPVVHFAAGDEGPSVWVTPGSVDSGALARRLTGTLRSPTFTIDRPTLIYHAAGRNGRVRIVIDGYQRLRDPIYGRLTADLQNGATARWYSADLREWLGQRAYVEFQDSGSDTIAVDAVALTDGGPPADAPNRLLIDLVSASDVTSVDQLIERVRRLIAHSAETLDNAGSPSDLAAAASLVDWALREAPDAAAHNPEWQALRDEEERLEAQIQPPAPAIAAAEGTGHNEPVHLRGNYRMIGQEAPRRFLEVCDRAEPVAATGTGRQVLAERILAPSDPLPARVIVNRLWQHHFGAGIVRTPDDFGVMGERPTHPELLDWLASEFVSDGGAGTLAAGSRAGKSCAVNTAAARHADDYACGWSLKKMSRMMVLSSAYRMDSISPPADDAADPQNRLLHRMPVRRLEAEEIRDAILAVSGRLDPAVGGPPVMPYLNAYTPGRGAPATGPLDGAGRRSIYLSVRRNFLIPMFLAFDYPNPITTIGRRSVSNVPAQALSLLNNPFVVDQAQVWAKRVQAAPGSDASRVESLYEEAFGRLPSAEEKAASVQFLETQRRANGSGGEPTAWSDLCHVLFNVKEFIYVR